MESVIQSLKELGRQDLAALLRYSSYTIDYEKSWLDVETAKISLTSPTIFNEALTGLPEWDLRRIEEAISSCHEPRLIGKTDGMILLAKQEDKVSESDRLLPELVIHRNQMIAVATGKQMIQEVNDYYRSRQRRISQALESIGLNNPNPYKDLWDWYHKWKEDIHTYADRRTFVRKMYDPLIAALVESPPPAVQQREPTGWARVDRAIEKAHSRMTTSRDEEDFQTVGLLCREVLISLGQAVFNPDSHALIDGVMPSETDARRQLECFIAAVTAGSSNEAIRKYAKSALSLAVELQHRRTADFRQAVLCLESTSSTVNIIAILDGKRDLQSNETV